jgi:hypothetical protein
LDAISRTDLNFKAWNRNFKFVSELYYKYLYDLVPFEFDNVLIRYFGQNKATGYSTGIDFRLHGEFVKGTDSYISLSVMSTKEDLRNDFYDIYLDENGERVFLSSGNVESIVDTQRIFPGSIARPTDQRVRFGMFFQDYLPRNENFKMHLNLVVATGLPFGPPDRQRWNDVLRIPPYRRLDIGFSAQLFDIEKRKDKAKGPMKYFDNIWVTAEIWNLLGVNNTISYLWVRDIQNNVFAVPNFLTNRLFNARLVVKF